MFDTRLNPAGVSRSPRFRVSVRSSAKLRGLIHSSPPDVISARFAGACQSLRTFRKTGSENGAGRVGDSYLLSVRVLVLRCFRVRGRLASRVLRWFVGRTKEAEELRPWRKNLMNRVGHDGRQRCGDGDVPGSKWLGHAAAKRSTSISSARSRACQRS